MNEKNTKRKSFLDKKIGFLEVWQILMAVFVVTFCYAGVRLAMEQINYRKADAEYTAIVEKYVTQTEEKPEASETATPTPEEKVEVYYPKLAIDFAALKQVNPDTVGWVYMETVEVSYPVVKGEDNEHYLHYTFEGQKNPSGAIFMDYLNHDTFQDYNTFLYGHNMKNGTMFGSLKQLYREEGVIDDDPYFYIYTEDGIVRKYRIFAYYITESTSDSYIPVTTNEEYKDYINRVKGKSLYNPDADTSEIVPMVTLSTCSGPSEQDKRFLVHGVLEAVVEGKSE